MRVLCIFLFFISSIVITAHADECDVPDNLSDYYNYGEDTDFGLDVDETFLIPDGKPGLYVDGKVVLKTGSKLIGYLYATGTVELKNSAVVTEDVYTESSTIILKNDADIGGVACPDVVPIPAPTPPIDLPVDELIELCNDIFQDAAQSYITGSQLFMQNDAQILDSATNLFPFTSIAGYYNGSEPPLDSCGTGVQCGITSPPSQELSSFTITANNNGTSFALWNDEQVELGGIDEDEEKYNGTVFQSITAGSASIITFLPLDYSQGEMFQVDTLIIQNSSTVKLSAGVYAVQSLKLDGNATIEVVGDGDVFFFVDDLGDFYGTITNSTTSRLFFIVNDDIETFPSNSFNASFYSTGNIRVGGSLTLYGQVAARNVDVYGSAKIVNNAICGEPPVDDNQFVIDTADSALTCQAHPVTLKVLSSDNSLDTDYSGVVDLAVIDSLNAGIGDWSMELDNGRLNNEGSGEASYQFNGTEGGQITLQLSVPTLSVVSLSMTQGALAADPQSVSFQSSMIMVEQSCSEPIGTQCINIANRAFDLTLTAIKENEDTTLCESYDPANIAFWSEGNPRLAVDIEQTPIGNSDLLAVSLPIEFSAGVATVNANYPDAGQIKIHLKDADIADITGVIETIVNPYQLVIDDATGNEREKDSERIKSDAGFIRASVPDYDDLKVDTFDVTAKAIIDCSSTGEARNCTSLGTDGYKVAPSFNHTVTLIPSLVFPTHASASIGTVYAEDSLSQDMNSGELTYDDLAYDEVGALGLQATSIDYILPTNDISASDVKEIGRFYPDHIAYTADSFNSMPVCIANDFAYIGESDSLAIKYTLAAFAQTSATKDLQKTTNYDADYNYPVATDFVHFAYDSNGQALEDNEDINRIQSISAYDESRWSEGNYIVVADDEDSIVNRFKIGLNKATDDEGEPTPDGPFKGDGQVSYRIKITGIDGEKLQAGLSDSCDEDRCEVGKLTDLMYGRLQAGNGHGSEFQSIRTLVEATYFDGTQFIPFDRDDCTTLAESQVENQTITGSENDVSDKSTLTILNQTLISGKSYFEFSAPSERGKFNYLIDLHTTAPWLLDSGNEVECKGDSAGLNDCISGYVEFGLFRGNDRIIYRMQTFD